MGRVAGTRRLHARVRQHHGAQSRVSCFVAELEGQMVGTGAMAMHGGVALLAGASTLPAFRGRGAQTALLETRLSYAADHGCDLAMMGAARAARPS